MCDVVFHEVVIETNVFGFVSHHCILRVCNGALIVFPNGGGVGDWDALDYAEQLIDVNSPACCVNSQIVLSFTC
jgi:hypothetical protein